MNFWPGLAVCSDTDMCMTHSSFLPNTLTLAKREFLWKNTPFLEPYHSVTMRLFQPAGASVYWVSVSKSTHC